jgi:hypothetical protein
MVSYVVVLKAVTELALMALVGRFIVGLLAGANRESNVFWRLLDIIASPPMKLARWISPKVILDRHIPLAAFFLTGLIWLIALQAKVAACVEAGMAVCR